MCQGGPLKHFFSFSRTRFLLTSLLKLSPHGNNSPNMSILSHLCIKYTTKSCTSFLSSCLSHLVNVIFGLCCVSVLFADLQDIVAFRGAHKIQKIDFVLTYD